MKINPAAAKRQKIKKVVELPIFSSSKGKTSWTIKLISELTKPTKEIATAHTLFGKSSENMTHITGPMEMANEATNPSIASKINEVLMLMAFFMNSVSYKDSIFFSKRSHQCSFKFSFARKWNIYKVSLSLMSL